ncbi:MAG: hypothetical protein U9O87_03140 [Verrucomicrobiota bacterium]|nr:hypothetical protein [Verrucomicrobiota bacterium]
MNIAINIPSDFFNICTDTIKDSLHLRLMELDWKTFAARSEEIRKLGHEDISLASVSHLLPSPVGNNLNEVSPPAMIKIRDYLIQNITQASKENVSYFCIDVGAEKRNKSYSEEELGENVFFFKQFIPTCQTYSTSILLPVRLPAISTEMHGLWGNTIQIVHNVMHDSCRMQLDLHISEIEKDFDIKDFLRNCYYHISSIRFIYSTAIKEERLKQIIAQWAEVLKWRSYKGLVVFAPTIHSSESVNEEFRKIDEIIEKYFE